MSSPSMHCRELYALRGIVDRFPIRPRCRVDAPAQIDKRLLRKVDAEGTNCAAIGRRGERLGKQADGTRGCDGHGRGIKKAAATIVDVFGTVDRIHW
jgi:hypothetical protein